jgi:hypothetical protein
MATNSQHGLSKRGWSNVEAIMPQIKGALEQRTIENNTNIDLSTAENCLIRTELMNICKSAILDNLQAAVRSVPLRAVGGNKELMVASIFHIHEASRATQIF